MEILALTFGILSGLFLFAYIKLLRKFFVVSKSFTDLFLSVYEFEKQFEEHQSTKSDTETHKDNFIKFLSDSREWAFSYIDDVQKGLKVFIEEVEPHVEYYKQYGVVVEGMVSPHDKALKTISEQFDNLKKYLPEEIDDRR